VLRVQRERLRDFDRDVVGAKFIDFLKPHLPSDLPLYGHAHARTGEPTAPRRQYLVEGPCETSYSLAVVNRSLALALDARAEADAFLVPAEGMGDYVLNEAGVRAHPEIKPLLKP